MLWNSRLNIELDEKKATADSEDDKDVDVRRCHER